MYKVTFKNRKIIEKPKKSKLKHCNLSLESGTFMVWGVA